MLNIRTNSESLSTPTIFAYFCILEVETHTLLGTFISFTARISSHFTVLVLFEFRNFFQIFIENGQTQDQT